MTDAGNALRRCLIDAVGVIVGAAIGMIVAIGIALVLKPLADALEPRGEYIPLALSVGVFLGLIGAFSGAAYGVAYARKLLSRPANFS